MKTPYLKGLFALVLLALLSACGEKTGSSASAALDRDSEFARILAGLDLEEPAYKLSYKDSGTSLGMKIKRGDVKVGKWLPKNEAADPEAQVVSYYLGRHLQMSELVIPAGYYTARGRALGEFAQMLRSAKEKNALRMLNQQSLLGALARNSQSMEGIFTLPVDSFELPALIETTPRHRLGTLRQDQAIARLIRAEGPLPSAVSVLNLGAYLKGGVRPFNSELSLARELSKIMVLDVLCGQYDRFSGGNLEGIVDPSSGRLHFIARDNGGASLIPGSGRAELYYELVTRFDRGQIELVRRLAEQLAADPANIAAALHIRSNPATLIGRVQGLLEHVSRAVAEYGEARVYFAE